jgi:hypothetical protein
MADPGQYKNQGDSGNPMAGNLVIVITGDLVIVSFFICILILLLMPLAGLHFSVRLDFVTPSL